METTDIRSLRQKIEQLLLPVYDKGESLQMTKILFEDILGITPTQLIIKASDSIDFSLCEKMMSLAERISKGEPIQYVVGTALFMGLHFKVTPDVLIPRPETEELVALAQQTITKENAKVLDIGTGSGCIPISLKYSNNKLQVSACDISTKALNIARENGKRLNANIDWQLVDILSEQPIEGTPFDVVISNPPYIRESEKVDMSVNVLNHEPNIALFVPNNDPLLFYRAIAKRCVNGLLKREGRLLFEINEAFGAETRQMLIEFGFCKAEIHNDFYGKERMILATL